MRFHSRLCESNAENGVLLRSRLTGNTVELKTRTRRLAEQKLGASDPQRRRCQLLRRIGQDNLVELLHRLEFEVPKMRPNVVPNRSATAQLLVNGLEKGATQLLSLVDQKRQHHQHRKDDRKIDLPVSEIVLEVIALVLESVERFVFDPPT